MTHFPYDSMNNLVGQTIDHDRYEILRVIGEGGTGRVYEAQQKRVHRRVAIKVLHNHWITDPKLVKRFKQEAFTASQLRHPNTVMIIDYGETETGDLYIVMELLKGQSLLSLLEQEGPLSIDRALKIIEQTCGAVSEVHRCGVLHRDLKPENIQIDPRDGHPDFVKLLDFSIAKLVNNDVISSVSANQNLTLQGAVFGTPQYMSPEQVRGKELDERTDVYALGVIFYQMLSGFVPFYENTPQGTMVAHLTDPVPRFEDRVPHLDIHPMAAQLVYDCLEKDPDQRVSSSDDLMQRLLELKLIIQKEAKLKEASENSPVGETLRFTSKDQSGSTNREDSDSIPTELAREFDTDQEVKAVAIMNAQDPLKSDENVEASVQQAVGGDSGECDQSADTDHVDQVIDSMANDEQGKQLPEVSRGSLSLPSVSRSLVGQNGDLYLKRAPIPKRLSTLESLLIEDPFSVQETQEYKPEIHGELKSKPRGEELNAQSETQQDELVTDQTDGAYFQQEYDLDGPDEVESSSESSLQERDEEQEDDALPHEGRERWSGEQRQ